MTITIGPLTGAEIHAALDDLARLRIAVFAAWPYLYDGDPGYEADYLKEFVAAPDAVLVAACDDGRIVGAEAYDIAAADFAFHRKAGLFEKPLDGLVEFGFQTVFPSRRFG